MSRDDAPKTFADVHAVELDEIVRRRQSAGLEVDGKDDEQRRRSVVDRVGLALSGGGIRSAGVNLGVLQALYKKGILRQIDYMSTVSGGGYVGSYLSSLLAKRKMAKTDAPASADGDADHGGSAADFPLAPLDNGKQPEAVDRLIHGGMYLRRPWQFLNRYALGLLTINLTALSGLLLLATLAAIGFRCLDDRQVIHFLSALGFRGDIPRALFPSFVCGVLWLCCWSFIFLFNRWNTKSNQRTLRWCLSLIPRFFGALATAFFAAMVLTLLMGFAALFGTGDISVQSMDWGLNLEQADLDDGLSSLKYLLVGILVLVLLPYFKIKDLIRSGTRPRNAMEGWVFALASRGLLYGIPLLLFGYLAREDISHHNTLRNDRYTLSFLNIANWQSFWHRVEEEATGEETSLLSGVIPSEATKYHAYHKPSKRLWHVANKLESHPPPRIEQRIEQRIQQLLAPRKDPHICATDPSCRLPIYEVLALDRERERIERETPAVACWLGFIKDAVGVSLDSGNVYRDLLHMRREMDRLQTDVVGRLNSQCISDPNFYTEFLAFKAGTDAGNPTQVDPRQVIDIRERARHLAVRYGKELKKWQSQRNDLRAARDAAVGEQRDAAASALAAHLNETDRRGNRYDKLERQVQELNWQLLSTYYGDLIRDENTVFAYNVVHADQQHRIVLLTWFGGAFLLSSCLVSLNITSLHRFYRDRLGSMWIARDSKYGATLPLRELDTTSCGGPYHIINATLNLFGWRSKSDNEPTAEFIFSNRFCGSHRTNYRATEHYAGGDYDLANAMAVSGAAVSPTTVDNPLLVALLLLSNFRLGQWIDNPGRWQALRGPLARLHWMVPPAALPTLLSFLTRRPENRKYCFVSDGGHHENLGVQALLERRCRVILASDAGQDPKYNFVDLLKLLRRTRAIRGVRFYAPGEENRQIDLDSLQPDDETKLSHAHFLIGRIEYPPAPELGPTGDVATGYLIYMKPTFTGDEDVELSRYRDENEAFPHDPTLDQFYDDRRFESYRQLGYHIAEQVCDQLNASSADDPTYPWLAHWSPAEGPKFNYQQTRSLAFEDRERLIRPDIGDREAA